jgi:hypothetical protein
MTRKSFPKYRQRPAEWYHEGIQALTSQWHKAIDSEGDYVEK